MLDLFLVIAVVSNGLLAGVFFSFQIGVTRGFKHLDDKTYVGVFQAINSSIENIPFLAVFFLAPVSALATTGALTLVGTEIDILVSLAATACSVFTFAVTVLVHVPLNRNLAKAAVQEVRRDSRVRARFEWRWNLWNLYRTCAATGAMILFLAAGAG